MKKISFSQYSMYLTCPHQYKLSYIDKLSKSSANIHTIFGTAVHETIQEFLTVLYNETKKKALEMDLSNLLLSKMKSEFITENEKIENQPICSKEELAEFYQDGIAILKWFTKHIDKFYAKTGYELVGIEMPLSKELKSGAEFIGYIDIVVRDKSDGTIRIIDIKTSTRGWSDKQKKDRVKNSQLLLYKKLYSDIYNVPLDKIDVEYHILRRKISENSPFPIPRGSKHKPANGNKTVNSVMDSFNSFVNQVVDDSGEWRELPYPKNPGPGNSNCKYCEFLRSGICDGKP